MSGWFELKQNVERSTEDAELAIKNVERHSYNRGVLEGIKVAEQICAWLTRQPDTERQRETREWAEALILRVKKEYGIS